MTMKTLADVWIRYKEMVYIGGMTKEQDKHLHDAFMSGAITVLGALRKMAELPEGAAVVELEKLHQEANEFARKVSERV
jgi:hypothetical protein